MISSWLWVYEISGWVLGILAVAGIVGAVARQVVLRWRNRPIPVIVQEVGRTKLTDMAPGAGRALMDAYTEAAGGVPRRGELIQAEWVIYNGGSDDVTVPVTVKMMFSDGERIGFVQVLMEGELGRFTLLREEPNDQPAGIQVELDSLPVYGANGRLVRLVIVSQRRLGMWVHDVGRPDRGWASMLLPGSSTEFITMPKISISLAIIMGVILTQFPISSLFANQSTDGDYILALAKIMLLTTLPTFLLSMGLGFVQRWLRMWRYSKIG